MIMYNFIRKLKEGVVLVTKTCHIFAAGDFDGDFSYTDSDLIIAADAGYLHLKNMGIVPHILMGDFDTLSEMVENCEIIEFSPIKDYTDTALCIQEGKKRGYTDFVIYGAVGGKRIEHTLANIQNALSLSKNGFNITLTDGNHILTFITNSRISLSSAHKGFISVFAMTDECQGVCIKNLKYELKEAILTSSNPLGVSNEFIGKGAEICVKDGTLMIVYNKQKDIT